MIDWGSFLNNFTPIAFNVIYFGVVIGTIAVVILDNRNPVKTIAWVLVLLFLPLIGLIIYFFFGRTERREKIISNKSYSRLLKKPRAEYLAQDQVDIPTKYNSLISFFKRTNQAYPYEGNAVTFYSDGYSKLQALMQEIYKAKEHIHIQYYILMDEAIGYLLRDLLIDKAKQGVDIRVIYDDVGSWKTKNIFFDEMRDAGIEVRSFLRVRFPLFTSKVNYRNHRKIVVIDGRIGFVGGMNIADRYLNGGPWRNWRDCHLKIEGKAVHGLQTAFLLDWFFVDHTLLTTSKFFPRIEHQGESLMQIVTSEPISPWKEIMKGLTMAISNAQEYFYIQTPYFLPTEPIMNALNSAALAGVNVRLMIPKFADSKITHYGSLSYIKEALEAGVKVYFFEKGFLHSKLMVSDDCFSSVGSTNIDFRSFEHNFEINAFMYDQESAKSVKEIFLRDQRNSTQIFLKNWEKRPFTQRVVESTVRLLAPLL